MKGLHDLLCPVRRITPADGRHYFYGYYDNRTFSADGRLHLAQQVDFYDRLPGPEDVCNLGVIDLATDKFTPIARTKAWNFQQGAMLEFLTSSTSRQIIYNAEEAGCYRAVIQDLATGHKRQAGPALADVSADGRWGLAINFSRLFDFRPGYGYCTIKDPFYDQAQPREDGIFLVDLEQGKERLILSYPRIAELFAKVSPQMAREKLVINHITFNPSADRFVFLVRNFPEPGQRHLTGLATADRAGQNLHIMQEYSIASHYHWRDDRHLLIYGACQASGNVLSMLLHEDLSQRLEVWPEQIFSQDIHCIYGPGQGIIAGDGYPDRDHCRQIFVFQEKGRPYQQLLRAWSDPAADKDHRCDLHNRFSPEGSRLSFDSTHEGFRGIYLADLRDLVLD